MASSDSTAESRDTPEMTSADSGSAPTAGTTTPETVARLNREQLRALSHPVRLSLLHTLSRLGHARAADLAEELELPANSMSYHLRILARGGLIREDPTRARDKRDRVWTLTSPRMATDSSLPNSEYSKSVTAAGTAILEWATSLWLAAMTARTNHPEERPLFTSLHPAEVLLTREQAADLSKKMYELVEEYRVDNEAGAATRPNNSSNSSEKATPFVTLQAIIPRSPGHNTHASTR
ncbi:ArsR/SmtB family transcription factor [Actinotignum timonense]|uniref:ArsR/SmtB family transcription factor n=1 Tax=Actinotignum TaxID=1653174 RepID=UPI00237E6AD7|nr:helix-turn-helix domain-containing protein [Actinotignum sanguinis]MDK6787843.1 helix-turn-helix domain-containing protein [Actinotignum timonense]MDE1553011.1 helix-turn-helix domain-containing protein [Actinotignum sanguinis]MDE1565946.1 helix-turn-helix domain-containing protein [Actinotignum sanguinis]MDE1577499.1 helix-turn-helix domain-containing protein [Actinotignum sanguinis]MDE1641664.1 helix-turn-helix domain-containing protein [Actinotignum sanguinis]